MPGGYGSEDPLSKPDDTKSSSVRGQDPARLKQARQREVESTALKSKKKRTLHLLRQCGSCLASCFRLSRLRPLGGCLVLLGSLQTRSSTDPERNGGLSKKPYLTRRFSVTFLHPACNACAGKDLHPRFPPDTSHTIRSQRNRTVPP